MKIKTQLTLLIVILLGFIIAIPTTAIAGRDHHRHGHKYGHSNHYDRSYRGYSHPRHHYKRHHRHKHSRKHHYGRHNYYYDQPRGYYKRKHRHHYRSNQYYPQPRYINGYNYNRDYYPSPSYGYPPHITFGFDTGNSHFMLRY